MKTKDRLAEELRKIGLTAMAERAADGYYDDYESQLAMPIHALVADLRKENTDEALALAQRAMQGDFDATKEEADAWAKSKEGGKK